MSSIISWRCDSSLSQYHLVLHLLINASNLATSDAEQYPQGTRGHRTITEMGLHTFPTNRQWRRRRDVLRQSVPQSGSGDRKSSIADGWKKGASDDKVQHIQASLPKLIIHYTRLLKGQRSRSKKIVRDQKCDTAWHNFWLHLALNSNKWY